MTEKASPQILWRILYTLHRPLVLSLDTVESHVERMERKKTVTGFPCLNCFASDLGKNKTPSGLYCLPRRLSCKRSADLEGCVNASNIVVFIARNFGDRDSLLLQDDMHNRTVCTFHVLEYRGNGGMSLYTPFTNLDTTGCWPTVYPSTISCTDEIADLYVFSDLYWYPLLCN